MDDLSDMLEGAGFEQVSDSKNAQVWVPKATKDFNGKVLETAKVLYAAWCDHADWDHKVPWADLLYEYKALWMKIAIAALTYMNSAPPMGVDGTIQDLAKGMFETYNLTAGGLTYDNKPIPPWTEIGDRVRTCWTAVAHYAAGWFGK